MTDDAKRQRLRGLVQALRLVVGNKPKRDLEAMGRVRPELMRVVYSHLSDEEAALRIRAVIWSDRRAAAATLQYVRRACDRSRSYETDRAYRVLVGAMNKTTPGPIRFGDAELFERERELGWMPLSQAFDRLREAVPQLRAVRDRAEQLAASPESFGITRDTERGGLTVPSGVLRTAGRLVGPESGHHDPLVRSSIAVSVVANYVTAVLTDTTDRSLWEHGQPRVTITGTLFEFGRPTS
jgi:hypothetical protein